MTQKTQELLAELERTLEQWPEDEQERIVSSYLDDLREKATGEDTPNEDPYSALKVLRDAKLSGSEDASVTYEKRLYGAHSGSDR